jgi:methanogenic corrinoid protein MtbC1
MSLLMNLNDQKFIKIAQLVFDEQFKRDPKLETELDERRKRLMYDDVIYNISFLMTSVYFGDGKIFEGYALWIYELLCNIMKDLDRDRLMQHMTDHYAILAEVLTSHAKGVLGEEDVKKAQEYIDRAIRATKNAVSNVPLSSSFLEGEHAQIRKDYLNALLAGKTKDAHKIIAAARSQGVPLRSIYEDILKRVMYEVGFLWHKNIITVDKEHYATSVTQTVMSGFYDEIFERPRKNKTLVCCAVGSELHEMGARMLSDLFEYAGWDTYYLGAALPEKAILDAITEQKPDLVALSVTMPPYLPDCFRIVQSIKQKHPNVKIAVGGQAFFNTEELWDKWKIDCYATSAENLVDWAQNELRS